MIIKVVVDTDVLIDYLRLNRGPLPQLVTLQKNGTIELYLSTVTVMELYAGLSSTKMEKELQLMFEIYTIIPFGSDIARFAGELKREKKFPTVPVAGYIIGTTAVWLKASIVTRNRRHFAAIPGITFYTVPVSKQQ